MWMYCGYEAIGSVDEEIEGAYSLIPKGIFICLPVAAAGNACMRPHPMSRRVHI